MASVVLRRPFAVESTRESDLSTQSIPKLPPEIVLHVISLMDPTSQRRTLVGVNRFLTEEVERRTYRKVDMTALGPRRAQFIAAIQSDRRRAGYVRTLALGALDMSDSLPVDELHLFHSFENIRSLIIHHEPSSHVSRMSSTIKHCQFPQLTNFHSSWSLNDPAFRLFLSRHPSLRSLGLRKSYSLSFGMPSSFPTGLLPALEDVDGHWSNVVRLVAGRPIQRVVIRSANSDAYIPRHKLAVILPIVARSASGAGVETLTLHVQRADADLINMVAKSLPSLRSLRLVGTSPVITTSTNSDTSANVQELELRAALIALALTQFERLDEFAIDRLLPLAAPRYVELVGGVSPALRSLRIRDTLWTRVDVHHAWQNESEDEYK